MADISARDALLYAAEDRVEACIGRRLKRWVQVEAFVQMVIDDEATRDQFTTLPSKIALVRRSRSATCSFALPGTAMIALRDGSWTSLVVLHEIAHLVSPGSDPHGRTFAGTELWLVRQHCGFTAYLELRDSFDQSRIDYREYPWQR